MDAAALRKRFLHDARVYLQNEAPGIPLRRRIALWRRGFSLKEMALFDLAHNDPGDYLPTNRTKALFRVNGPATRVMLSNKLLFAQTFGTRFPVPTVLGIVDHGQITPFACRMAGGIEGLVEASVEHEGVVLKPLKATHGRGVMLVEYKDEVVHIDGAPADRAELERRITPLGGYMVLPRIRQAAYAQEISPFALNTIRVLSIRDPDSGEAHIVRAAHRFATRRSAPADNVNRGGVVCGIDLTTNRLGSLTSFRIGEDGRLITFDLHPDTGARVRGVCVPGLADVWALLREIHVEFPALRFVGWDVAITDAGPVLIEGNDGPDLKVQRETPFLADPRMRRFLEVHGVFPTHSTRPGESAQAIGRRTTPSPL